MPMLVLVLVLMPLLHRDPSLQRLMAITNAAHYLRGTAATLQNNPQPSKTCKSRKLPPVGAPAAC
jgi:hypothetical protein